MVKPEVMPEWAQQLAVNLRQWCAENGYPVRLVLAKEIDLSESAWRHVIRGDTIAADPEIYAKVYHRTGLLEADPRTVPPLRFAVRTKPGVYNEKSRSFTEEQWQNWLASKEASKKTGGRKAVRISPCFKRERPLVVPEVILDEVQEVVQTPIPSPPQSQVQSAVGSAVDGLISVFAGQIGRQLVEAMRQEGVILSVQLDAFREELRVLSDKVLAGAKTEVTKPGGRDISALANKLRKELNGYAWGTPDDRDRLMKEHGQALVDLVVIAHTLIQEPSEREKVLPMNRQEFRVR